MTGAAPLTGWQFGLAGFGLGVLLLAACLADDGATRILFTGGAVTFAYVLGVLS